MRVTLYALSLVAGVVLMALSFGYLLLVALDLLTTGEQYDHGVPVAEGLLALAGGLGLFTLGGVHLHERRRRR